MQVLKALLCSDLWLVIELFSYINLAPYIEAFCFSVSIFL